MRPLRTPWVNNFVTGSEVARIAAASEPDSVVGLDTRRVALTYQQFAEAFPAKIADSDYVPEEMTFTYWLDACNEIVKAQVTTQFGPDTAELMDPDFPLRLDYSYESYDLGGEYPEVIPGTAVIPIPPPADS